MNVESLIQTMVLMNMKDVVNMSIKDLFPMILCVVCYQYRQYILDLIQEYLTFNKYKSEFVIEIKVRCDTNKDKNSVLSPISGISLLWLITNNVEKYLSSISSLKTQWMSVTIKKVRDMLVYDALIPSKNSTIKLDDDIYLEFVYTTKNINGKDQEVIEEKTICLNLKSKYHDSIYITNWLDNLKKRYVSWRDNDNALYLYSTCLMKDNSLDYQRTEFNSTKSFQTLFFEQKDLIIKRLKEYEDIPRYKKLGIPHTLGFLFHGEPGCGKTSCIKAIANHLNRSIITINLKYITNIEFLKKLFLTDCVGMFFSCHKNKRIYVFEEMDCGIDENENPFLDRSLQTKPVKTENSLDLLATAILSKDEKKDGLISQKNNKITTGEVLELLDGLSETDDRIIIFTTNYPEKIDKAFLRPGRIDLSIEFKKLRRQDINDLYKLWFGKGLDKNVLNKIKDYQLSQADFGKLCFENTAEQVAQKLATFN